MTHLPPTRQLEVATSTGLSKRSSLRRKQWPVLPQGTDGPVFWRRVANRGIPRGEVRGRPGILEPSQSATPMRATSLLLAIVCLAAGCDVQTLGASDASGPSTRSGTEIVVRNQTANLITEVNLSPCSDTSWGDNDLRSSLAPGASRAWEVDPGCWDLRAVDSRGAVATRFDVQVPAGGFTWSLLPGSGSRFAPHRQTKASVL